MVVAAVREECVGSASGPADDPANGRDLVDQGGSNCVTSLRFPPVSDTASGTPDAVTLSRWRRIVDGLAASGDPRAVGLQRIDE